MIKNIKHFSFLYKDFRLLKFSFTLLTLYLLMYELYNCFVTKPTFQSVTQSQVSGTIFLVIVPSKHLHSYRENEKYFLNLPQDGSQIFP